MNTSLPRALVFVTGRDCQAYVGHCLDSLREQSHAGLHVLFVDDASDDRTYEVARTQLQRDFAGRHTLIRNAEPWGKARNAHLHLRAALGQGDFVAVLDADDRLILPGVLADMAKEYELGYDVVWTNYETDGGGVGGNGPLDPLVSPRGQGWKTSHFFSFRAELFKSVPEVYFCDDEGRWFLAACDFAIAFPILDQTRRYRYLPVRAYRYTASNPRSHHNRDPQAQGLNSRVQQQSARQVLSRPALPCLRHLASVPGAFEQVVGQRLLQIEDKLSRTMAAVGKLQAMAAAAPFVQQALSTLTSQEKLPLSWLRQVGGWALDIGLLAHVAELLDGYESPRVLEFGSGRGSKALARVVANRGGTLVSIEHDPKWHAHTLREIEAAGLDGHADVRLCPLVDVEFFTVPGRFYDMSWLMAGDRFDLVIVDGPPAVTCKLARLPAFPAIAPHLSPAGFHVLLDDFERAEERQIVAMWQALVPDLHYETLEFSKGVCSITTC